VSANLPSSGRPKIASHGFFVWKVPRKSHIRPLIVVFTTLAFGVWWMRSWSGADPLSFPSSRRRRRRILFLAHTHSGRYHFFFDWFGFGSRVRERLAR
jgi:hypothetical protein